MKAAVFSEPRDIHLADIDRPEPGSGEARISVCAAGVCAGDLYIYLGKNPYVSYPRVGGHEIAGFVESLGPYTSGPALGTRVVVEPFIGCGECYPCRVGKSNCCANLRIIGVHSDGGFAESVIAPVDHLHAIPAGMSMGLASFAEPVAIAVQACRRGAVAKGEDVLVLGAGPIGLAMVEVLRARGARPFITDPDAGRLETAAGLGGVPLPSGEGLMESVMSHTSAEGMSVVMEATGVPAVMEQTAGLVAAGGRIVIVGLAGKDARVSFPALDLTRREMTVLGSRASVDCFPESLDLIARGAIGYTGIATNFDLDDAEKVFSRIATPDSGIHKAILMTGLAE